MERCKSVHVPAGSRLVHVLRQPSRTRLILAGWGAELFSIDIVDRSFATPRCYGFALDEEDATSRVVTDDLLIAYSEDTQTVSGYRLEDGAVVFRHVPGLGVFALPGGEHLGVLWEDRSSKVRMSLQRLQPPYDSTDISELLAHLDLDAPQGAYLHIDQASGRGYLLIACYGYCQLLDLLFATDGCSFSVVGERILSSGLVMDPVYLREARGPRVALWHGYGAVAVADLVEGRLYCCPEPEGARPDYGLFSDAVQLDSDGAVLVSTKQRRCRWRVGAELWPVPETELEYDQSVILSSGEYVVRLSKDVLTIIERPAPVVPS